jgi:hypothetical protein
MVASRCASRPPGKFVSDIFREIDEELRRDNLLKLWAQYGRYVIIAAAAILLAAGGAAAWRSHQRSLRQAEASQYAAALTLAHDGKTGEAEKRFEAIAAEGGGYAVLASLERAELLAKAGDRAGADAVYHQVATSEAAGQTFRDLAVLLGASNDFATADPKAIIARLQPLTQKGNPWRPSALDLTAAARLHSGDRLQAVAIYKQLADDPTTPPGLRARAAELAAALGS